MRIKNLLIPYLAFAAGLGGLALRRLELTAGVDADGLPVASVPGTALLALSAAVLVLAAVAAWRIVRDRTAPADYAGAFPMPGKVLFALACAAGAAMLVLVPLEARAVLGATALRALPNLLLLLFAELTALSVPVLAWTAYRGKGGPASHLFALIPPLFFCYLLIAVYRANGANPFLREFMWPCLACMAAALAAYYAAGFPFGRPKPAFALLAHLLAVYLLTLTLIDLTTLPGRIAALLFIQALCLRTARLLGALTPKDAGVSPEPPAA